MLSVRLICVGKLGEKFWADAVKEYTKRLGAYCKLEIIELPEQRLPQTPSEGEIAQALEKEAALISIMGMRFIRPALFTRMSTGPTSALIWAIMVFTAASSVTSAT